MPSYSPRFRAEMLEKMLPPNNRTAYSVSQETGVSAQTLRKWLLAATVDDMTNDDPTKTPRTLAEKTRLLLESKGLKDEELGAFLRREGIFTADLEAWQAELLSSLEPSRAAKKRERQDAKRIKQLERELKRKEKALAETAALLVLRKKNEALLEYVGRKGTAPRRARARTRDDSDRQRGEKRRAAV